MQERVRDEKVRQYLSRIDNIASIEDLYEPTDWPPPFVIIGTLILNIHSLGIVHRNLGPQSIFEDTDGDIKLANFAHSAFIGTELPDGSIAHPQSDLEWLKDTYNISISTDNALQSYLIDLSVSLQPVATRRIWMDENIYNQVRLYRGRLLVDDAEDLADLMITQAASSLGAINLSDLRKDVLHDIVLTADSIAAAIYYLPSSNNIDSEFYSIMLIRSPQPV